MTKNNGILKDMVVTCGIIAALIVFFYKFVFLGMVPLNSDWLSHTFYPWKAMNIPATASYFNNDTDPVLYMYPIKYATIAIMKAGSLPLWNPQILCGAPLWGNNFACPLNPLNIVFFIFDFAKAWGIFIMLQFACAGIFMYLLSRELGASRPGGGIAALAYMLNGTFVIWFQTLSYLGVFCWLPLVFLLIEKTFRSKSFIAAFWCGLSFALFVWCGLIQLAAYCAAFSLAYLFFRCFQSAAADRSMVKRYVGLTVIVIAAAAIYSLPELVVQKTNIMSSTRTATRYGLSLLYPQMLVSYLSPYFYGMKYDGWDLGFGTYIFNRGLIRLSPPYIGILPLLLAAVGLFSRKNNDRFFFLLASAGILIALSVFALPVVYKPILKYIPFFGSVDHYRLTTIYAFSMALMAGWGVTALSACDMKKACGRIATVVCAVILSVFMLLAGLSHIDAAKVGSSLASVEKAIPGAIFDRSHTLKSFYKFIEYLNMLKNEHGTLLISKEVYIPIALALISIALIIMILRSRKRAFWSIALFSFVAADLLYYALAFPAWSDKATLFPKTPSAEFLLSDKSLYRVVGYSERDESPRGDVYPPNTGMIYGLQDVRGYENIGQARWFYRFIMGDSPDEIVVERFNDYGNKFLPFLNVKYLMSKADIVSDRWKLVYDEEIKIYKSSGWMPRAFVAGQLLAVQDGESAWSAVQDPSFDPSRGVVIQGDIVLKGALLGGEITYPAIKTYASNEVVIETAGRSQGILVLSDTFFPGWKVFVDGKEREVLRANYAFRGVAVNKEDKLVRFVFRPAGLYESLFLCVIILIIMLVVSIRRIIMVNACRC